MIKIELMNEINEATKIPECQLIPYFMFCSLSNPILAPRKIADARLKPMIPMGG